MLQYLVIILDDSSVSFCHYKVNKTKRSLIPIDMLKQGIRFSMMENLMVQFVYPDYELPQNYSEAIESVDHFKIKPVLGDADVWVIDKPTKKQVDIPVVLRITKQELFKQEVAIVDLLDNFLKLNIVITDVEFFTEEEFSNYKAFLEKISANIEQLYIEGKTPQLNLLTDRMMLKEMNNCGAGDTSITLAPNGKFYVCPAFYYENEADNVGDLEYGLDIKNRQLYRLDHAPICRHCDAWQCKRCIWLNRKTTLEVNTPSHEQCVVAHLERNESRLLLQKIRTHGMFLPDNEDIKELDYLDPFEKREDW